MKIPKNIIYLFSILIVLGVVSVYILIKINYVPAESRPLQSVQDTQIAKIVIKEPSKTLTLEKKGGEWWLREPIGDLADPTAMDQLLGALKSFTLGSVISENKDKYPTFGIDAPKATAVKVYEPGKDKPVLDILIGKQAVSYGSSYLRFADQSPVYIANNLPNWLFIRSDDDYRLRKIVPIEKDRINKLALETGPTKISLVKSSDTWSWEGSTAPIAGDMVPRILEKVVLWTSNQFQNSPDPKVDTGLNKPAFVFTVGSKDGSKRIIVGAKRIVPKGQPDRKERYVQTEGRGVVLLLDSSALDEVVALMKGLPK